MTRVPVRPIATGRWSGGGRVVLNNLRYAAELFPGQISFDSSDGIPLLLRHAAPMSLLVSGRFLYMPQNAWVWDGPYGKPSEAIRRIALRAASELAMARTAGLIRISEVIPDRPRTGLPVLHNTLDREFELSLAEADAIETQVGDAIVCIGSIGTYRNVARLIEAFDVYRNNGGSLRLVLQGPVARPVKPAIHRAVQSRPYVELKAGSARRSQVLAMFRECAAAVFPALVEASSLTLLEALAVGCPVIASNIPGHVNVSRGSLRDPMLFDPRDVSQIAGALSRTSEPNLVPQTSPISTVEGRESLRSDWSHSLTNLVANHLS